jgi:hypothetical protein
MAKPRPLNNLHQTNKAWLDVGASAPLVLQWINTRHSYLLVN